MWGMMYIEVNGNMISDLDIIAKKKIKPETKEVKTEEVKTKEVKTEEVNDKKTKAKKA